MVIDKIGWLATNYESEIVNDPVKNRIFIFGEDDLTVMQVLLSFMEMQLLITLQNNYFSDFCD